MIVVVDYGAANLLSITRALEAAGAEVEVSGAPERIALAEAVVLPGVGAAGSAMRRMRDGGVDVMLRDLAASGRPLLGICLGMQLLFERLEEDDCAGLGLLAGDVVRLRNAPKVPHMGWNTLEWDQAALPPLARATFASITPGWRPYFVHSYACRPDDAQDVIAWTEYGEPICAAVAQERVLGLQFHPEKSGAAGVGLLRGWLSGAIAATAPAGSGEAAS